MTTHGPGGGPPRYALDVQAATLFEFLGKAFPRMPRLVQIVTYLVLLILFAFLVLYPLIGITYVQGKIVPLTDEKNKEALVKGLKVSKGFRTYTNEEGEFTLALRLPNVLGPLVSVDLHIVDDLVAVPAPVPFVSLFNPNPLKIYYVPGSEYRNKLDQIQNFFVDAKEAHDAWVVVRKKSPVRPPAFFGDRAPFPSRFSFVTPAQAAEQHYSVPTYTLRLRQLKVAGAGEILEAYFDVKIDGKPVVVEGLPTAASRPVDHLTIVRGVPVTADLDIPLPRAQARVEIDLLSAGFFRATKIASAHFDIKAPPGERFAIDTKEAAFGFEVLPPVAIGGIVVLTKRSPPPIEYWLDVPPEFLDKVAGVSWLVGDSVFPGVRDRYFYRGGTRSGTLVKARVTFASGSALTVVGRTRVDPREPRTPAELWATIEALRRDGDADRAAQVVEKALNTPGAESWALQTKGAVLREIGRFDEALSAYQRALRTDRRSVHALSGYALTVVDRPTSRRDELVDARRLADEAIMIDPSFIFAYVALGGIQMRLGENAAAIETHDRVVAMERRRGSDASTALQRSTYYAGRAYAALGRKSEARRFFQRVLDYEKWSYLSIGEQQFVALARKELDRL